MIHEYALDPDVLVAWASNGRDYAEFLREYGLGTPRLVSSFPKLKPSKFRSYFLQKSPPEIDSLKWQRYQEMVIKLAGELIIRDSGVAQDLDWIENVTAENNRLPFDVVLSSSPIDVGGNVTPITMYLNGSIWLHERQKVIRRNVADLSGAIGGLVRLATDSIVVIDAYGWTVEAIIAMQHIVRLASDGRVNNKNPVVLLCYRKNRNPPSPSAGYVKNEIMRGLGGTDPTTLRVLELDEIPNGNVFHNRCLLTEHGGVILGHGVAVTNIDTHTDEVTLMEADVYHLKWGQFVSNCCYQVISSST